MSRTIKAIENIDPYMKDIRMYDCIDTEEEKRLASLIKNGNIKESRIAKDALIVANLRLVVKIAHDFKNFGLGFSDIIAEGNLGLITAVDKFDPDKGAKFSCYAAWWIKQYIRKAIAWQTRVIRIPDTNALHLIHMDKARLRYMQEYEIEPSVEELSKMINCPESTIRTLMKAATETLSMDETVNEDSDTTFDAMLANTKIDESQEKLQKFAQLEEAINALPQLGKFLITKFYGIDGPVYTPKTLGQELGLSLRDIQSKLADYLRELKELLTGTNETSCQLLASKP